MISRDGQRLFFMYSRWDFAPWILTGDVNTLKIAGPDRLGLRKSAVNPFWESDYYMATKNLDGTWGEPVNLGLNGDYGDASGMEFSGSTMAPVPEASTPLLTLLAGLAATLRRRRARTA